MIEKISIVTISYNNVIGLKLTLDSLAVQTNSMDLELIVIDGGSTDGSVELLKGYTESFGKFVWISEPDTGIYNAMNKGLRMCSHFYVGYLNSGDTLYSIDTFSHYISIINSQKNVSAIYGDILFRDDTGKYVRIWRAGVIKRWKFYFGWMPPHPMTVIKKSLLIKIGGFDERLKIAADYKMILLIFYKMRTKAIYLEKSVVCMENGGLSNGRLSSIVQSNIEVLRCWYHVNRFAIPFWIFILKPVLKILQLQSIRKLIRL
jgi:glycosyltransferase involved in cell wall biosynthesis